MELSKLLHGLLNFLSYNSEAPSAMEETLHGVDVSPQANYITNVLYEGAPAGYMINVSSTQMYVSEPRGYVKEGQGVLFLADVLGLASSKNLILADSFAREGYFVLAPDIYKGRPAPDDHDRPDLGFNATHYLLAHTIAETDPIVELGIKNLRNTFNISKVATAGYCFGAKYAFRFATEERRAAGVGVDVVVVAHPTNVTDDEIKVRRVPASIAAGQYDALMPPERRWQTETALLDSEYGSSMDLYSGVPHGFAIRVNLSDPVAKFVKQEVFTQHITWLNYWMPKVDGYKGKSSEASLV